MAEPTPTPLEQLLPELEKLKSLDISKPSMPIEAATREAVETAKHVETDAAKLNRFKIVPMKLAADIRLAASALEEAESQWQKAAQVDSANEEELMEKKPLAYDMHDEYISLLDYIYDEEGMEEDHSFIKKVAVGSGDSDLVLDMKMISDSLNENHVVVAEYEIHEEDRKEVEQMYLDLSRLLGATDADRTRASKEKEIRDCAFWYLQELVGKARKAGKVAFRRDPKGRARYRSAYRSKQNRKAYLSSQEKLQTEE